MSGPSADLDVRAPSPPGEPLELVLPSGPVQLGYVRENGTILLIARDRSARWPIEILRSGRARLRVAGVTLAGSPRLLTRPDDKEHALHLFRAKYGLDAFARWYDRPARIVRLRLEPHETSNQREPSYYDWIAAEFDNEADDYDLHIAGNRINGMLRERSLTELRRIFGTAHSLIELGCGAGVETLPLLREGHEIMCVDISERMLEVVRGKARAEGRSEQLRTRQMRASELSILAGELPEGEFDGGYSTYGAFNCEADLGGVPVALHRLLAPEAAFLAGVYNRWCLFELLGYSLTGQFARAFGRVQNPVPVGSSRYGVDVFAYSPSDFVRLFRPYFRLARLEAVPFLLPPSDLVGYAERFSRRFDILARWDRTLGSRWPFQWLGDNFLATFRRQNGGNERSSGGGREIGSDSG